MDIGRVNAKKRKVYEREDGKKFVLQDGKRVFVRRTYTPKATPPPEPEPVDTGKVDAKKRKVYERADGKKFVVQNGKRVFVQRTFTPKATPPPEPEPVDTGKVDAKKRKVYERADGKKFVLQNGKRVFVRRTFTPQRASPVPEPPRQDPGPSIREPVPPRRPKKQAAPHRKEQQDWKSVLPEKFFCASRGLLQKNKTCWFNASLNGIVLASATSAMLLEDMKKLSRAEIRSLSDMAIRETCPRELSKKYVYSYALHMHEGFQQNRERNESTELVGKMFTPGRLPSPVRRGDAGYYSLRAVEQILRRVFPDKHVALVENEMDVLFVQPTTEFILFDPRYEKPNQLVENIKVSRLGTTYTLSHCVYVVKFRGESSFHAVAAYVCDGVKSVYDSNKTARLDVDWLGKRTGSKMLRYSDAASFKQISYALYVKDH